MSVFQQGTDVLVQVRSADGKIQTQRFLEACRQILPVVGACSPQRSRGTTRVICGVSRTLGNRETAGTSLTRWLRVNAAEKLGTGFALVKSDVGGNIDRLATRAATSPTAYDLDIFQILRDEVAQGSNTSSSSCTKGLLWLKRWAWCCFTPPLGVDEQTPVALASVQCTA